MSEKKNCKKHKTYYLVDYENVHQTGLNGINELEKNDNVVIFYSQNADKLPFSLHSQIVETKAKIIYFEVDTVGKNALDFQLSSYIGYIVGKNSIGKNSKNMCYIISNDSGYENVCNFWRKQGMRICRIPDISQVKRCEPITKSEIKEVLNELELEKEDMDFVKKMLIRNMERYDITIPQIKSTVHHELIKKFGNERTKVIYSAIKRLIK